MLNELTIQNLVLIDDLNLKIEKGFSVITGETGAGKSILLSALKILAGEKAKLMIRDGNDFLKVEAHFEKPAQEKILLQILQKMEIDIIDEIIIERKVYKNGKNRCRINGSIVKLGELKEVSEQLFDIYGQQDHRFLRDEGNQLLLLDKFGGTDKLRGKFSTARAEWKLHLNHYLHIKQEQQSNQEQQDYFEFQWQELSKADLKLGEDERIENTLSELKGIEKIQTLHQSSLSLLSENGNNIKANLQSLIKNIQILETHSEHFKGLPSKIQETLEQLEDISKTVSDYEYPQSLPPGELDQLNSKLAKWQRLQSKYKTDLQGLIQLRDKRKTQLDSLENSEHNFEVAQEKISESFKNMKKIGVELSKKRKLASKKFETFVNKNLSHLGMEQAEIFCQWKDVEAKPLEPGSAPDSGLNELTFLLSANKGQTPRPLSAVASGGETSRIMLAIKSVLAEWDSIPLLVFDEIDSGIGGITCNRVGEALKKLSQAHQVIAITHLHQVAAWAKAQINVTKKTVKGNTFTSIQTLKGPERIVELARMMGDDSSGASLKHAQNILEEKS